MSKPVFILNGDVSTAGVVYQNGLFPKIPDYHKKDSWFVLTEGTGDDIVVDSRTTTREIRKGQYKRLVEISKNTFTFQHTFDSSCLEATYTFKVTVKSNVYVNDPVKFNANVRSINIQGFLENQLSYDVKMITQKYSILDYNGIDQELKTVLPAASVYNDAFGLSYQIITIMTEPNEEAKKLLKKHDDMALRQRMTNVAGNIAVSNMGKTFEELTWEAAARGEITDIEAKRRIEEDMLNKIQFRDDYTRKNAQADLDMLLQLQGNNLIGDADAMAQGRTFLPRQPLTIEATPEKPKPKDNMDELFDDGEE